MDLLSRAVDELGLRRTRFQRFVVGPAPWALAYDAGVQGVHLVASGACELVLGDARTQLGPGDLVILPRGQAHHLRASASAELVCGTLDFEAKDHPMLASVGEVLVLTQTQVRDARRLSAWVEALVDEVEHTRAGSDAVITRLAELLFIEALRVHASTASECPSGGWFKGLEDPSLGRALSAFHSDIAAGWSVASLAKAASQSRAVFARRFTEVLGEAPLAYARRWRLFHARRLLRTSTASLEEVAARVGYGSAAAFSLAFSRDTGLSPGAWRASQTPAALATARPSAPGAPSPAPARRARPPATRAPRRAR